MDDLLASVSIDKLHETITCWKQKPSNIFLQWRAWKGLSGGGGGGGGRRVWSVMIERCWNAYYIFAEPQFALNTILM